MYPKLGESRPRPRSAATFLVAGLVLLLSSCSLLPLQRVGGGGGVLGYDPSRGLLLPYASWHRYDAWLDRLPEKGPLPSPLVLRSRAPLFEERRGPEGERSYLLSLDILGPAVPRSWILFLPVEGEGVRATVNGQSRPIKDRILSFEEAGPRLDILVQVPAGAEGLDADRISPEPLMFGEAAPMGAFLALAGGAALLLPVAFALGFLFIIFLFNLWTKNREFLAFALVLGVEALRYLEHALSFLPFLHLPLDRELLQALLFLAHFAALAWFFVKILQERASWPSRLVLLPLLLAAGLEIGLPRQLFLIHSAVLVAYALSCLAVFGLLLVRAIRGSRRALWLHPSPLFLLAAVPLRFIFVEDPLAAYFLEPLCTLLFALVAMAGLLRKVRYSFKTTETLNDYVADMGRTVKRFIPAEFLQALGKRDVVDLRLGDHVKREMTIFFSDIRAFTELSEQLSVEENFAFINSYLSRVVPVVKANGGFIDKYIGDAIMALFPGPEGPDEAIQTAIEMQVKMTEYNGHRAKSGYRPIQMGVGIHSGSLMLGVVGVDDRMENTVISDAVNLASRLQAITKAFNVSLAISEEVFKSIRDPGAYTYRFIGKVKVKGKVDPVSVFEIFDGIDPALMERKIKANTFFEQGMLAYYQKDFPGAMYYFKRVLDIHPEDGAAAFYLETCMNRKFP